MHVFRIMCRYPLPFGSDPAQRYALFRFRPFPQARAGGGTSCPRCRVIIQYSLYQFACSELNVTVTTRSAAVTGGTVTAKRGSVAVKVAAEAVSTVNDGRKS